MGALQQLENEAWADLAALDRVQTQGPEAFSEIVHRYTPVLFSLAFRLLGADREAAEEAVQDIFLKTLRSIGSFDRRRRFYPWLYTIALNHLRSQNRTRGSRGRPGAAGNADIRLVDPAPSPEDLSVARDGEQAAQRAIDALPLNLREAFLLRMVQGLSTRDTAEIMGAPEATVRTWVFRARDQLRARLLDQGWS